MEKTGLSLFQKFIKRTFDIIASLLGLFLFWWLILLAYIIASIDTKENGFFIQQRVGRDGKLFKLVKIKTMGEDSTIDTHITKNRIQGLRQVDRYLEKQK